jgi:hypothetical protein
MWPSINTTVRFTVLYKLLYMVNGREYERKCYQICKDRTEQVGDALMI